MRSGLVRGISYVLRGRGGGHVQQSPGLGLRGRRTELAALDRLLAEVRAGQSRVLVLRGEAGVGKTALLDYLQEQASGFRVARAAGVESEMELAFAGLHQLCTPMLSNLAGLPGLQPPGIAQIECQ